MSYLPHVERISAGINLYHTASATIANGAAVSWANSATTGHDFSISKTASDWTVPVDGNVYVFEASLAPGANDLGDIGVTFQWYVDGVAAGNIAIGYACLTDSEASANAKGDERARCVVQAVSASSTVTLKINQILGTPVSVDDDLFAYEARARAVVWRL
jgi:hypothetical protein